MTRVDLVAALSTARGTSRSGPHLCFFFFPRACCFHANPFQALRQGLRVLGSSKLLGSPLGLFSNISAGVKVGVVLSRRRTSV